MAFNHIHFNRGSQYGSRLAQSLSVMESADDQQADVRDMLLQMIDGDGSLISMFDEVVRRLEVLDWVPNQAVTDPQRTAARNLWLQVDSAYAKTSGDGAVSSVRSARNQLYSFLRG
jgi:hypothetical protein